MNMFTYANTAPEHDYNLRTNGILENATTKTSSGENCIRFQLPVVINNTNRNVLDKVSTHSYEGFAFYVKRITICNYNNEYNSRNCYVCNTRSKVKKCMNNIFWTKNWMCIYMRYIAKTVSVASIFAMYFISYPGRLSLFVV